MNRLVALLLASGISWAAWAAKPKYEPVPPEVWNLKLEDTEGTGAIILKVQITLDPEKFEYYYRIRILNEGGKAALGLLRLNENVEDLWGRTVTRDGKEMPFTDRKDLLTRTVIQKSDLKAELKIVVPPGITPDCFAEFHWTEPRNKDSQGNYINNWASVYNWRLAAYFPIQEEILTFPKESNWNLNPGKLKPDVSDQKNLKRIVFSHVPALEDIPFALDLTKGIPSFTLYGNGWWESLSRSDGGFWADYGTKNLQPRYDKNILAGQKYILWSQTMLKDLPASPHKAAEELVLRLDGQIQNISHLTYQEYAQLNQEAAKVKYNGYDLNEAVKQEKTTAWGMFALFYQLLKDAKFNVRILMVADRTHHLLSPKSRNIGDIADTLVGVEEKGKGTLWLDPSMRFAPPGLILPNYQGTTGIAFDTTKWSPIFIQVPIQPAQFNQKRYTYELKLGEEENRFSLNTTFTGYPEYSERSRFMPLELKEQNRDLRRQFEDSERSFTIDKAEVLHATDPRENVAWCVQGHQEFEGGRRREVVPFPGLPWPLNPPGSWPAERKDLIVLPYCSIQLASSSFTLPRGYKLLSMEPLTHSNTFGRVAWMVSTSESPAGVDVKVVYRVDINKSVGKPEEYAALKEFVSWIQEGAKRTLILEKVN